MDIESGAILQDVQRVVDQIHKRYLSLRSICPPSSISSMLIIRPTPVPPSRKSLHNLWICATILSNACRIVPSSCNSLTTRVSKGPFTVPRQSMFR